MKKFTLALTVAALAIGGTAASVVYAQQSGAMASMSGKHGMMPDPLGDATITRAEAQAKAVALFDQHDANRDGKLDKADHAVRIGEHFDKMDANRDGAISKQEFIAAHDQPMTGHDAAGHKGMGHKGMMGHGMKGMDANDDHAITRDEFVASALKRFDTADANRDGKLTKNERRAAMHTHMRERREGSHGGMKGGMGEGGPMGGHD